MTKQPRYDPGRQLINILFDTILLFARSFPANKKRFFKLVVVGEEDWHCETARGGYGTGRVCVEVSFILGIGLNILLPPHSLLVQCDHHPSLLGSHSVFCSFSLPAS